MATSPVPSHGGQKFVLPTKPVVQVETSSGSSKTIPTLVTTKPRSEKTLTRPPLQTKSDKKTSKGTVLLRNPAPKYSFQVKKPTTAVTSSNVKDQTPVPSSLQSSASLPVIPTVKSATDITHSSNDKDRPVSKVDPIQQGRIPSSHNKDSDLVKTSTTSNVAYVSAFSSNTQPAVPSDAVQISDPTPLGKFPSLESLPFPDPSASPVVLQTENAVLREENEKLQKEKETLKKQLEVQFEVNAELKKLLVASVGDDLQFRVENLARDKAQLSSEIGTFAKKRTEDYESLDKISIQADMWRSKFLASRVMVDELASAKAFLSVQTQESQSALQQMLTERHELRRNLLETYRILQQVKSAFDPLNQQNSAGSVATNSLDLARMNQRLSEAIRYRLLPNNISIESVVDLDIWTDNLTFAEARAHEFLSKKIDPDDVKKHIPSNLSDPGSNVIDRFHPYTRFDNLTVNCCVRCQGELFAV